MIDKKILFEPDPSGKSSKKDYLMKYHNVLYDDIINYANNNNIINISFKEQVYCYKNNIVPPKCKNPNCEKTPHFINSNIGYKEYCSRGCIGLDPDIQKRKEQKSIEKFGTKTPAESKIIKDKIIKTNNERYGSNCSLQNIEIKKKSQETLMKNYKVDNPNKSKETIEKRVSHFDSAKWRINFEKSMLEKYNVKNALQNEEIKQKVKQTNLNRYGVENVNQITKITKKRILTKKNNWKNKLMKENSNIIDIDLDNQQYIMKCDCGKDHDFTISFPLYKSRKQFANKFCTVCFPPYINNISQMETELLNFIKEKYNGIIITNTKSIISPYELDIYLPDLKLAFEFNGLYWHNELNKSKDYHELKSNMCDKIEIQLFHIWEDDWKYKQDIVKSMILNKLGLIQNKIYARKTIIKEVDTPTTRIFLNNSHIQGYVNSAIRLGLYYNDELVSLMTIGKPRKNMNSSTDNVNEYELLRFCNKINTTVVGGASKLFNYFVNKYNPELITTYADRSYSKGNLYKQLGFEFVHITKPNYYYVVGDHRKYRFGFRKDLLIKEGYDPNKTEHEIMLSRDIYRIFNSGNYKFIYNKK